MPLPIYPMRLCKKSQLSRNTLQLSVAFEGEIPNEFSFVAGQFIQFLIPHNTAHNAPEKRQKRSYSIANSPESFKNSGVLDIAISFVEEGLASELFRQSEIGLPLSMSGPFGVLTLPESIAGQLILVGTGTGIAPYRAMIPQLQHQIRQGGSITLIMGARYREDVIYLNEFKQVHRMDCRVCLSRETHTNPQKNEFSGYVQQPLTQMNLNPKKDLIYLCGHPSMIDDSVSLLQELGFPPRQIKREKYVFSGH